MRFVIYGLVRSRCCARPTQQLSAIWPCIVIVLGLFGTHASAQTITTLCSFNGSDGNMPNDDLTLIGNTLYGTTWLGGNLSLNGGHGLGTVFSVPVSGGTPTVLATFNGSNGALPASRLTLIGDVLATF